MKKINSNKNISTIFPPHSPTQFSDLNKDYYMSVHSLDAHNLRK